MQSNERFFCFQTANAVLTRVVTNEEVSRGFIKVLNRKATEFDTQAKNWQGPEGLAP